MATLFTIVSVVLLLLYLFRNKIRDRAERRIEHLRKQEQTVGEIFRDTAREKQEAIRCLVFANHHPWGCGYRVRLTWLGEPDTMLAVTVNCWRGKNRMIEIEGHPTGTFYGLDQKSQEQAVEEWKEKLTELIHHD